MVYKFILKKSKHSEQKSNMASDTGTLSSTNVKGQITVIKVSQGKAKHKMMCTGMRIMRIPLNTVLSQIHSLWKIAIDL